MPLIVAFFFALTSLQAQATERFITVASTTSTANSGLFDSLLPQFTAATGIEVRVVAVGTGQAIRLAENGDADVLLVHHRPSEEAFVAHGFGVKRYDLMYNDFVLVGPANDPAQIDGCTSAADAMASLANSSTRFVSRGDDSGTHKREKSLWKAANVTAKGAWYLELGAGMGATLNSASAMGAYTLSDRGTWISFKNKGNLAILCESDSALFNPYGVILVDPKRFPHVKAADGQAFIDWLISDAGQQAIGDFQRDGEALFTPSAP